MSRLPDPADVEGVRKFRDVTFLRLLLRAFNQERELVLAGLRERGYDESISIADLSLVANCDHEGHSITQLAKAAGVTRQAASQHVSGVEGAGLVARVPDPDDSRVVIVRRTPEGDELLRRAMEVAAELEDRHRKAMGDEQFDQLKALMNEHLSHVDPDGLLSES